MNRVIYADSTVLSDKSVVLNDYYAGTCTFPSWSAADDALYIGTTLPFNHFYVGITTANTGASVMSVSHWDGDEWKACVEVIDETAVSGCTLGQSGYVTFVPNKDNNWNRDDTDEMTNSGLTSVTIYDLFWTKITLSGNLTANVALSWLGNYFSNDSMLAAEYPELTRSAVMTAISAGKTDYNDQHYVAAQIIVKDLLGKKVIFNKNQLLEKDSLGLASVAKVAQLIYNMLGPDYEESRKKAEADYYKRLDSANVIVDLNGNAAVDVKEQNPTFIGMLYR